MKNLKTQLAVLFLSTVSLLTGAYGQASTTTTVQFDTPAITGASATADLPPAQYLDQGIEFVDSVVQPVSHPISVSEGGAYLFLDPANARSGKQVLASYATADELLQSTAGFLIHFTRFSSKVSLYAGASSPNNPSMKGANVQITGYDEDGNVVASTSANVGSKVETLLSIDSTQGKIAYLAVQIPGLLAPRLEINDLSFVTPAGSALTTSANLFDSTHLTPVLTNGGLENLDGGLKNLAACKDQPALIVPKILSVSQGVGNPLTIIGDKPFTDASVVYFGKTAQPGISVNGKKLGTYPPNGMLPGSNADISVLLKNACSQAMVYSHQTSEVPIGEVDVTGPIPTIPGNVIDQSWAQGQGRSFNLGSPKNLMVDNPHPVFYVRSQFTYTPALENNPLKEQAAGYAGNLAHFSAVLQMCSIDPKAKPLETGMIWGWPSGVVQGIEYEQTGCKNWDGTSGVWMTVGSAVTKTLKSTGFTYIGVPTGSNVFNIQNYLRTLRIGVAVWLDDTQFKGVLRATQKYTEPFDVAVVPTAFYQIKVEPMAIIYAPPGDQSTVSFAATDTYNTSYTTGNSKSQSNKVTGDENSSWSASLQMTASVDAGSAKVSGSFTSGIGDGFDNSTTTGSGVQNGTQIGGSSAMSTGIQWGIAANALTTPGNGTVCASATSCSTQTVAADWWRNQPFWNDTYVLRIHPQYAFYVLGNNTDRSVMYASVNGGNQVQVLNLWACANGTMLYGLDQCTLTYSDSSIETQAGNEPGYVGTSNELELTPTEAKHLLTLDPFYVGGQGAIPAVDRASVIKTGINYGVHVGDTQANPVTIPYSNTQAQQQQASGQTTYTSSIVNTTSTTESNAFNFAASFIVGFGFGYSTADTDKTTIEADTQSVYTNSNAASTQQVTSASVTLNDVDNTTPGSSGPLCKNCHDPLPAAPTVNVYLDRTFGGFMFQDPAANPLPSETQRTAWEAQFDVPATAMAQEMSFRRFDDVDNSSPQKVAIGMLVRLGVMMGYADGKFHPNDPMTRAQLAVALHRSLRLTSPKTAINFDDLSAKSSIRGAAVAVVSAGLLTSSAGKFRPADSVSHDEFGTALGHAFKTGVPKIATGDAPQTRGEAAQILFATLQSQK
jgi:S-layer homology domain